MARRRLRTALALASVLVAAAACASPPSRPPAAAVDGVRSYRIGYADGCSSGFKAAAGRGDAAVERWEEPSGRDKLYLEGWAAGHYTCRLLAERPGWEI